MKIKPLLCAAMVAATTLLAPSTAHAAGWTNAPVMMQNYLSDLGKGLLRESAYGLTHGDILDSAGQTGCVITGNNGATMKITMQSKTSGSIDSGNASGSISYDPTTKIWSTPAFVPSFIMHTIDKEILLTDLPLDREINTPWGISLIEIGNLELWGANIIHSGSSFINTTVEAAIGAGHDVFYEHLKYLNDYTEEHPLTVIPYAVRKDHSMYVGDTIFTIYFDESTNTAYSKAYEKDGTVTQLSWTDQTGADLGTSATIDTFRRVGVALFANPDGTMTPMPFVRKNGMTADGYYVANTTDDIRTTFTKLGTADVTATDEFTTANTMHAGFYMLGDTDPNLITSFDLTKPRISRLEINTHYDMVSVSTEGVDTHTANTTIGDGPIVDSSNSIADVPAIANIDGIAFKVVVPTQFPIDVDSAGVVYVANNASIENLSPAAIAVKGIDVEAKPASGWILVDTTPSKIRDAKEFRIDIPVPANPRVEQSDALRLGYRAYLSPTTDKVVDLEIASVLITVGWAD